MSGQGQEQGQTPWDPQGQTVHVDLGLWGEPQTAENHQLHTAVEATRMDGSGGHGTAGRGSRGARGGKVRSEKTDQVDEEDGRAKEGVWEPHERERKRK